MGEWEHGREVIKEVLNKTIKIGNIVKIKELIEIGSKYVETNIRIKDIQDYLPYILDFDVNNIQMDTILGHSEKCNGVWLFITE